ncbi:MAG: GNAT family N-acetyltransferase [Firmicutes bacterium]|jgi:ribosomal protein S18 acetylase RimI-like enzyme|nr:GNAT family N-acetyltransferase [Bacillota bacterium]
MLVPSTRLDVAVRRASVNDMDAVYEVASSVGNAVKDPSLGFLVYDYTRDPDAHKRRLLRSCAECSHFYVAELNRKVCGFLIGWLRDEWVSRYPEWFGQVTWRPGFKMDPGDDFFMVDVIAVHARLTGRGVGTALHKRMIADLAREGIRRILSESVIGPIPNVTSMMFRTRMGFELVGIRYEDEGGVLYTNAVYSKINPLVPPETSARGRHS